jgi:hypothetical protein
MAAVGCGGLRYCRVGQVGRSRDVSPRKAIRHKSVGQKHKRRHRSAKAGWKYSDLPAWLDKKVYRREIQPRLKRVSLSVLATKLGISIPYAVNIRSGRRVPHQRHWLSLAELADVSRS